MTISLRLGSGKEKASRTNYTSEPFKPATKNVKRIPGRRAKLDHERVVFEAINQRGEVFVAGAGALE